MANKTITQLPAAESADQNAVVAADNAAGTQTQKVTLGQIATLAAGSAPVQSVAGRTGTVTLTTADVSGAVNTSDSRLTDARTPTSHSHGNITSDGKVGSAAGRPLITTSNGVVTTGNFGALPGWFCEGNDSRLSNSRNPNSHKTSHATGGSDALSAADIGAAAASHTHDYNDLTNKPTLFSGDYSDLSNKPPVVVSDATGIAGADAITNIVSLTQAEYDALASTNPATLYVIV